MNFFEYQDQARRNTIWLVILFVVGVAATIVALYVAVTLILIFTGWNPGPAGLWSPGLLAAVSALTLGILLLGSGSRYLSLRAGGEAVAEALGGQQVQYESSDPAERRLVNVVEEMAIASGTPVPKLYVMEEESINAFAAGRNVNDAVIGVTRGCIEKLNRDEMQGVIAHEFSHIVNQDMRINMRLMVIIAGLIAISLVGRQVLFSMRYAVVGRSRNRNDGKGQIAILLIGLAMLVIGSIGVLCSRMIKAAISRQREYLADASAVQFTRHPDGLAGALKAIQEQSARINHPRAEEASHMFFGDALSRNWFSGMFSTHPPLQKRIARLDPEHQVEPAPKETPQPAAAGPVSMFAAPGGAAPQLSVDAARVHNDVGTLSTQQLDYGKRVVERLPADIRRAAHESLGAVAIAYALVLDEEPEHRGQQMQILKERVPATTLEEVQRLEGKVRGLDPWLRLPLAELLLPGLRQMTREQYAQFAATLRALILHDEEVSIFQFALSKMVLHQLEASYARRQKRHKLISSVREASEEIRILLSALAKAGAADFATRQQAFETGIERLPEYTGDRELRTGSFQQLDEALDKLSRTNPKVKEKLIDACSHAALADQTVNLHEAELLRAVAATLDCPLPPFVPRVHVG